MGTILFALAAAGLAYFLGKYFQKKAQERAKEKEEQDERDRAQAEQDRKEQEVAEKEAREQAKREAEERKKAEEQARKELEEFFNQPNKRLHKERDDAAIDSIAKKTRFGIVPVEVKHVKVGTRMQESPMPAEGIAVRTIRSVSEIQRVLPSSLALDDDLFYGKLASRQLPVIQHMRRVDVFENKYGVPRKVIVILQDVSPSMDENGGSKAEWSMRLCRKVIERAEQENAEVILVPFGEIPGTPAYARNSDERTDLIRRLPEVLGSISGTNIQGILEFGTNLLSDETFTDRKILLITDGQSQIDAVALHAKFREFKTELNTVCIGDMNMNLGRISNNYDFFVK